MYTAPNRGVPRRGLAKGVAWAVPAVAVVAAAPAYAASGAPAPPATVVWSKVAATCETQFSWSLVPGATSYIPEYSTNNGTTWQAATPASTSGTSATAPSTTTNVRVSASNAAGISAPTAAGPVTNTPGAPTILSATRPAGVNQQTTVTWSAVPGAVGYQVSYSTQGNPQNDNQYTNLSAVGVNDLSQSFSGGVTTYVRVRSVRCGTPATFSPWSAKFQVTPP